MSSKIRSTENNQHVTTDESQIKSWDLDITVYKGGYWEEVDERFYGDGTPNSPPMFEVPELLAADMEILEDPELVDEVSNFWFPEEADEYTKVIKVIFNDLRTWHWPLRDWEDDKARFRESFVEDYIPQIIKWRCILKGEDYKEAIKEFEEKHTIQEPDWESLMEEDGLTEKDRVWFNKNADWLPHISPNEVEETDIDIEVEDKYGWMEEVW